MSKPRTNASYLSGIPELLVLSLLARRPMYGYELIKAIKASTRNELEFGEGCIYPILHRLEAEGQLSSREEMARGRSRLVYSVTSSGRKQLAERVSSWERVATAVNDSLRWGDHEQPAMA